MELIWIADFSISHNIGGAQRTDDYIISEGLKRGHTITPFYFNSDSSLLTDKTYDIVVTGNLDRINADGRNDVFRFILGHPKHVRLEHDSNAYLSTQKRRDLFSSTILSLFLTEYHKEMFDELYSIGKYCKNIDYLPDHIDTNKFYNCMFDRIDKTLYVGYMHPLKGTNSFFTHVLNNPDKKFVMASWGSDKMTAIAQSLPNLEWIGAKEYGLMPSIFNAYKTLYCHPTKFEPFCRSVGEAILCGMELDCSNNIGAIRDYNKMGADTFKAECSESKEKFWKIIEEIHDGSRINNICD